MPNIPTYAAGISRLNGRNLEALLALSSVLSAVEVYGHAHHDLLFLLLNNEKIRLLADAILISSARSYKEKRLDEEDFRYVFNSLDSALYDPRIERDIPNFAERDRQLYGATKFFARMANLQIRQQQFHLTMHAGRAIGMLAFLPERYPSYFPGRLHSAVATFPGVVRQKLGASVLELAFAHRVASLWYGQLNGQVWSLVNGRALAQGFYATPVHRQAVVLQAVRGAAEQLAARAWFTAQSLHEFAGGRLPREAIEAYLSLAARSVRELREMGREAAYQIGPDGWRLSPLERHPIVAREGKGGADGREYLIPNVRTHLRSFAEVIHFTLQDALGDHYNDIRGALQEVYLRRMIEEQLPGAVVVPEQEYRRGKQNVRGPDLTVADARDDMLIVVESKARRTQAETRFTMEESVFDGNFADVYDALKKSLQKIIDIRAGAGGYAAFAQEVGAAARKPICVCVVGEAVYFINDLVRHRAAHDPAHPLYGYPYPFCIMSLDSFEFATAIARQDGVSLGVVLRSYWDASPINDVSSPRADDFGGRKLGELECFGASFVRDSQ